MFALDCADPTFDNVESGAPQSNLERTRAEEVHVSDGLLQLRGAAKDLQRHFDNQDPCGSEVTAKHTRGVRRIGEVLEDMRSNDGSESLFWMKFVQTAAQPRNVRNRLAHVIHDAAVEPFRRKPTEERPRPTTKV